MTQLYLKHHGIKGQKWGDRNGPPYPLSQESKSQREQDYSQTGIRHLKNGDIKISKNTEINRMTRYDESQKKGHAYVTFLKNDSDRYAGFFGARLKAGPVNSYKSVYQVTFKPTRDLKSPGERKRVETFGDIYKNDEKFRNELASYAYRHRGKAQLKPEEYKNMTDKQITKEGYDMFTRAIGDKNPYIRDAYFNALTSKGYDFVIDDLDRKLGFGRAPAIVFDAEKSLRYEGQRRVSSMEIAKSIKNNGVKVR